MNRKFQFIQNKKISEDPSEKVLMKLEKVVSVLAKYEEKYVRQNIDRKISIPRKSFVASQRIRQKVVAFTKSDYKLPDAIRLLDVDIEQDIKDLHGSISNEISKLLERTQKHKSTHPHITGEILKEE